MKKITIIIFLSLLLSLNANAGSSGDLSLSKNENGTVKDCFEGLNRGVFAFNKALDNVLFEPIAKGYRFLPSPLRSGASNALGNLSNVVTIPNNILQGEIKKAGNNTARFAINTTIGILGLFDPATKLGFEKLDKEDYGQTLATWGVGEGCYIVLPVLGPSTARDTVASITTFIGGDAWYNVTVKNDTSHFTDFDYYASRGLSAIDFRAKNIDSFENLEKNSMDFYASVKSLYLQDRQKKILNSETITPALDDSDWEEIEG
jgi:phospholipid-binding lipoprotein MlaA